MSKIVYLTLESASLLRCSLGGSYDELKTSAAAKLLWGSGSDLLEQTKGSLLGGKESEEVDPAHTKARFQQSVSALAASGIETSDEPGALDSYIGARKQWIYPSLCRDHGLPLA